MGTGARDAFLRFERIEVIGVSSDGADDLARVHDLWRCCAARAELYGVHLTKGQGAEGAVTLALR
jgi:hypothetical protein